MTLPYILLVLVLGGFSATWLVLIEHLARSIGGGWGLTVFMVLFVAPVCFLFERATHWVGHDRVFWTREEWDDWYRDHSEDD